jgi:hypothetical protein
MIDPCYAVDYSYTAAMWSLSKVFVIYVFGGIYGPFVGPSYVFETYPEALDFMEGWEREKNGI